MADEEIIKLAAQMVAFQNFNYRSLPEAKKEIYFGDIKHCFDALSFCTYYSSLNHQQKSELSKILFDHCDKNMSNEERKCRKEYESLFHYLQMPNNPYRDYSISKETRPDFVLAGERAVGIEVVEFITEQQGIMNKIANKNFGRGKSAEEIYQAAKNKHGSKAERYTFSDSYGTATISLKGLEDANQSQLLFASKILSKWHKYKEITNCFERFIVLCDARYTIAVTDKTDCDDIMNYLEKLNSNISNFTICILYDGNNGLCVAEYAL